MNRTAVNLALTLATAACGLALTGCSIDARSDRDVYVEHRRPVIVEEQRPVIVDERPPVIIERGGVYRAPRTATLVARGHQKKDFDAPGRGVVTVIDSQSGRVEVQRAVRRGDHLAFDPDKNKAWLNGHTILDHDLNSHHIFEMYFEGR